MNLLTEATPTCNQQPETAEGLPANTGTDQQHSLSHATPKAEVCMGLETFIILVTVMVLFGGRLERRAPAPQA